MKFFIIYIFNIETNSKEILKIFLQEEKAYEFALKHQCLDIDMIDLSFNEEEMFNYITDTSLKAKERLIYIHLNFNKFSDNQPVDKVYVEEFIQNCDDIF
jgi:hypothetical protein